MRLEASDLACIRGGRQVFSGVGFAVAGGEALAVTGRNGAGKSSLLRMIAGLVRIAGGRLSLTGGDPDLPLAEQAHYLGHQDALKTSLTVEENLGFWTRYLGGGDGGAGARRGRSRYGGEAARRLSFRRPAPAAVDRAAGRGEATRSGCSMSRPPRSTGRRRTASPR